MILSHMKLKKKVAIVAGGGQGIGEGVARCLAEEGADVAIADINGEIHFFPQGNA